MFEGCDVDVQMFQNDTMKNIKRMVHRFGKPLGQRFLFAAGFLIRFFNADCFMNGINQS